MINNCLTKSNFLSKERGTEKLACFLITNAQDVIIKRNGDEIIARVLEVDVSNVKYKRFSNENGPVYSILKSDIFMIKYENGDKDLFNESEEGVSQQTPVEATTTASYKKGWIGIGLGAASPVGNISEQYGTGALCSINFGYLFTNHVGLYTTICGTASMNAYDSNMLAGLSSFLIGPLFSTPLSENRKVELDFKPLIGYSSATFSSGGQSLNSKSTFSFAGGASFRFNLANRFALSANIDYIYAKFDRTVVDFGGEDSDFSTVCISIGAAYRF